MIYRFLNRLFRVIFLIEHLDWIKTKEAEEDKYWELWWYSLYLILLAWLILIAICYYALKKYSM